MTSPPFEVCEAGWGEFFITARIFLVDETLPPVEMIHFLKVLVTHKGRHRGRRSTEADTGRLPERGKADMGVL